MADKTAGLGAAIAVLLLAAGLMFVVGVIVAMMWFQPGIARSPSSCLYPGQNQPARALNLPLQASASGSHHRLNTRWGEA